MWRALLTSTLLVSLLAGVVSGCFDARRSGLVEARGDSASDGGLTDLSTTGSDAPSLADVSGNDGALDGAVEGDTAPGDTALPDSDLGSSDISVDALLPDGGWPTSCGYTIEHRYPMQNEALFRVEVYGVDELGRTTSYERDDDANGSSDYSATFDYYGGSVTIAETTEKTFSATGALRTRVTRHFDPAGQEVSVEVDKDGDGVLDERVERTYADNGTLLSERRIDAQSGLYLTEFLVSLTDFGSVARKEWYENGELKQVERYSYDDESRLARFELDQDGDGLAEIVRSYSYLEEGEYLFTLVDYGDDGSVDERIRQSYYPSGRVATLAIDAGNKGHFRWLTSYSYHPNGTLATREHQSDDDQDGTIDSIDLETFDETGRPLVNEWDADADGQWDQRLENVYGPHGLTQTTEKTSTSVLRTTTYGYTPNGALESRETRDGTGELQESELRTYDSSSRLQSILTTKNDAILLETGTAQVRQVYHYDGCSSP